MTDHLENTKYLYTKRGMKEFKSTAVGNNDQTDAMIMYHGRIISSSSKPWMIKCSRYQN